jgi:hypothetical protein
MLLGYLSLAGAAPAIYDCPRIIDIEQTTRTTDATWELVTDSELPPPSLSSVTVYTQHPSDAGNLVADQTENLDQTQITTWRLPADSAPYWMACIYTHSRVVLAKPIPLEARQCRLTEALRGQKTNGVLSFTCE